MSASWSRASPETSAPSSMYRPALGRSRQPRIFIKVDLPEPLAPINATNSPRWISSETPRTARTSISPARYVFSTSINRTTSPLFMSILASHHGKRRGPPPNGLAGGEAAAVVDVSSAVTTRSPSFKPSTTSVMTPSLIPVLICTE